MLSLSKYNAHTEPLFKTLLKIDDMLKLNELKFYYKYEHDKLPKTSTFKKHSLFSI